MKKSTNKQNIILMIILVIFMLFSSFVIKHWDTVTAVVDGFRYSDEEIENIRIENQKEVDKALSKYPDLHFRNLTEEEIKAVALGQIKKEEISLLVTDRAVFAEGKVMTIEEYNKYLEEKAKEEAEKENEEKEQANNQDENKPPAEIAAPPRTPDTTPSSQQNNSATNPELAAVLEKFFVLKATFLSDIEEKVDGMIAEYKALPKAERTKETRAAYANRAISLMAETEPVYDSQFEAVHAELVAVIEKIDGDESLVDTVKEAYKREKATIKSKYVSRARKHLK